MGATKRHRETSRGNIRSSIVEYMVQGRMRSLLWFRQRVLESVAWSPLHTLNTPGLHGSQCLHCYKNGNGACVLDTFFVCHVGSGRDDHVSCRSLRRLTPTHRFAQPSVRLLLHPLLCSTYSRGLWLFSEQYFRRHATTFSRRFEQTY